MFSARWIRENGDLFDSGLARRGVEPHADRVLALDASRRAAQAKFQEQQHTRNRMSKEIGAARGRGEDTGASRRRGRGTEGRRPGVGAEGKGDRRRAGRTARGPPQPAGGRRARRRRRERQRRDQAMGRAGVQGRQRQAALRDRRGAGPDGLRAGRKALRLPLRRALRRAGAGWSARSPPSCSTCTPPSSATPRPRRRCWSAMPPPSAPATCRSSRRTCSTPATAAG